MTTFFNKALTYLGLKDADYDLYGDDYDVVEPSRQSGTGGRTVYPEWDEAEQRTRRVGSSTLRPLVHEESDQGHDEAGGAARSAIVRPLVTPRAAAAKVHVVAPSHFADAQEIGDLVKASNPVILNLQASDRDLARRMIDFCSGLTYALSGSMEKVADQVFLLTPSNVEVSQEDRLRLQERGLLRS